jgi:hypothetical protein
LAVNVDTLGIAHLQWERNIEPDFMGYRILRSFEKGNEKSVITPQLLQINTYTDTLSLNLLNRKVYYSLTALDNRYNESRPSADVEAHKPNLSTHVAPKFSHSSISDNVIKLTWVVNNNTDIIYTLYRKCLNDSTNNKMLYKGDLRTNEFSDELNVSGEYEYTVIAEDGNGKSSESPQKVFYSVVVNVENNTVKNFGAYVDQKHKYIELSWKSNSSATLYRIYKAEKGQSPTMWKEVDGITNRVVDDRVSPDTQYTYTILFRTENTFSEAKTIIVNY